MEAIYRVPPPGHISFIVVMLAASILETGILMWVFVSVVASVIDCHLQMTSFDPSIFKTGIPVAGTRSVVINRQKILHSRFC